MATYANASFIIYIIPTLNQVLFYSILIYVTYVNLIMGHLPCFSLYIGWHVVRYRRPQGVIRLTIPV